MTLDVIVIGAGQGGLPLATAFARAGRKALVIERAHLGGTCINVGCTPTKTMVASARAAYVARRSGDYGVRLGDVSVDMARIRERKQRVVESFRSGKERALERAGVDVVYGTARFIAPKTLDVTLTDGTRRQHSAEIIVIDTGTRPFAPTTPGLADVPFFDSASIMELAEIPEHLLVLGGGPIGLEFAQMFRRFGSRVSVLQRSPRLLSGEDADVADEITRILRDDGVDVILGAEVARVARGSDGGLTLNATVAGGSRSFTGSHLLVAAGRVPNTEDLDLAAAGIAVDARGFVRVNERLETNVAGVYALGDVAGQPQFTHVSYDDFRILRRNLLGRGDASTEGRVLPYTIYIDPQLGRIGMTERQAVTAGHDVRIAKLPMAHVARAIEVDETRGFMKAVVDAGTQRILGAAVLGIEGGEIASLIQVAMLGGLPYSTLRDGIFAHPTLAESLNNLFRKLEPSALTAVR